MTTLPVKNVVIKDGKIVRKRQYRAKNKAIKADRLAKAWQKKRPPVETEGVD